MAKITWRDAEPDDPMYTEGVRSYSPHWARTFLTTTKPPTDKDNPQSEKPALRIKSRLARALPTPDKALIPFEAWRRRPPMHRYLGIPNNLATDNATTCLDFKTKMHPTAYRFEPLRR